jgi:hypothetical protein
MRMTRVNRRRPVIVDMGQRCGDRRRTIFGRVVVRGVCPFVPGVVEEGKSGAREHIGREDGEGATPAAPHTNGKD